MALLASLFLVGSLFFGIYANEDVISNPVERSGEILILDVSINDSVDVDKLTFLGFDISNVSGNTVTIYVDKYELSSLEASDYEYKITGRQFIGGEVSSSVAKTPKGLGSYQTYSSLTTELQNYADEYPEICRLSSLGQSVNGRELWAMLISDNPDTEEDEPEFKYVSTMHGDEVVGTEMCLYLIDLLLTEYISDDRITDLVDETEIWIVPLMNPDGYESETRFNARGIDLNRNFPVFPDDYDGTFFDEEPLNLTGRQIETQHVMKWSADNSFVLSANIHTGALVVNYPYDDDGLGSVFSPTPDEELFVEISLRYSIHNGPMWNSSVFEDGITNGADWYSVDDGMQDWNYRYLGCNEVTLELSNIKTPTESSIPGFWDDNRESMLSYMESVHMGVRGLVTDRATGDPLWAEITIEDNSQPVFTDPDVGDYHRMLLPGTYSVNISAPQYIPTRIDNVEVTAGETARLDITLAYGDVDNNNQIDATDIQLVINAILGLAVEHDCDLDGGGVGATDLQLIVNAVLND